MRHKIPKIKEVNLELIDPSFYFSDKIKQEDISVSLSVKSSFGKENVIIFFIHVRYLIEADQKEKQSLFHTDYLSVIQMEETDWSNENTIEIEKSFLAHLLGMSILMVRGSISQRLSSSFLGTVQLPVINPTSILEESMDSSNENYILNSDIPGHSE